MFIEELRPIYLTQPCFPKDFEPFAMVNNFLNPIVTMESCSKNYTTILMNDNYYFWMKDVRDEDFHCKKNKTQILPLRVGMINNYPTPLMKPYQTL
jgi:hypothetical protein